MLDIESSMSVGYKYSQIDNVEDDVYYAKRYEIMPLPIKEQCWFIGLRDGIKICLYIEDTDTDIVGFQIEKDNISSNILYFSFYDDYKWDEVIIHINEEIIEKCVRIFEMKICIEVDKNDKNDNHRPEQLYIIQMNVLTLSDDDEDNMEDMEH